MEFPKLKEIGTDLNSETIENIRPHGHACNVLEYPEGSLLLAWYCGSYEGAEDQKIAAAIRAPDGKWRPTKIIQRNFPYKNDMWIPEIPVPMLNPAGETVLYFFASPMSSFSLRRAARMIPVYPPDFYDDTRGPLWIRSVHEGKLFRTTLTDNKTQNPTCLFEKPLRVYGAPLHLKSGRWIMPCHSGEVYVGELHTHFLISDDDQESWRMTGDVYSHPGCNEATIVQLPEGQILCYMRYGARGGGHIWRSISRDQGRTWSPPKQTNLRNPHSGVDIKLGASNRLLIAYNDSYLRRTPLCVGISEDLGKTFCVRDIEMQPGEYSYPKLLQTSNGLWHLFYTYNRTGIKHVWFEEEWLMKGREVLGLKRT